MINEIPTDIGEYIEYDETSKTGLRWKKLLNIQCRRISIGDEAGHLNNTGYYRSQFNARNYLNHRIVYFLYHGYCPDILDHIDGNRQNNNINNLREATLSDNGHNRKINKNNKLGHKNIYPIEKGNYKGWVIEICVNKIDNKRTLNQKEFTIDDAIKIRDKMIDELCGEFGNNGT